MKVPNTITLWKLIRVLHILILLEMLTHSSMNQNSLLRINLSEIDSMYLSQIELLHLQRRNNNSKLLRRVIQIRHLLQKVNKIPINNNHKKAILINNLKRMKSRIPMPNMMISNKKNLPRKKSHLHLLEKNFLMIQKLSLNIDLSLCFCIKTLAT